MSEPELEIIRQGYAAFDRGDVEAVLELCHEDVLITQPPDLPGVPAQLHGHSGMREALKLWPEQWDDYRSELVKIVDAPGDKVLATVRTKGRGKHSGIEVEMEFNFVFAVREGKISEWRLFIQENQALEAAGLSG